MALEVAGEAGSKEFDAGLRLGLVLAATVEVGDFVLLPDLLLVRRSCFSMARNSFSALRARLAERFAALRASFAVFFALLSCALAARATRWSASAMRRAWVAFNPASWTIAGVTLVFLVWAFMR